MDIIVVLEDKYPGAEWKLSGDTYAGLTWLTDTTKPTEKALEALWPEVKRKRAHKAVESARAQAYRETSDPIFFQYQAGEATEQEWKQARQAVKTAHPYPKQK